jgi:hypothetical protein
MSEYSATVGRLLGTVVAVFVVIRAPELISDVVDKPTYGAMLLIGIAAIYSLFKKTDRMAQGFHVMKRIGLVLLVSFCYQRK